MTPKSYKKIMNRENKGQVIIPDKNFGQIPDSKICPKTSEISLIYDFFFRNMSGSIRKLSENNLKYV